jgi:ABC-2 type transport system ATP-binding protein
MTATIEYVRASRWYGPVIALNDVTTVVEPGVTGLLGPNGAGKSTFLKLAAGQLAPSQGEVRLLGVPAWGSPGVFHHVGLCPEADAFWEGMTGLQFVTALLRLTGYDEAECRQRAEAALNEVALLEAKDRKIGGYSKGMRQRVKLAQAIAHDPQVLLLDEPVSGMDPINRRHVVDLVKRLGREGKTVLVSSHILHEVEAMTRRVLLIHNGRILAEGDVREIRDLMDEHPHTVALRARDPRALARAVVGSPHVLSLTFGGEGEWVTVQTARPDDFYGSLHDAALEAGVSEMYSPDENLESVFKYLVAR